MTLSPGQTLSHYRLVEHIGEGGMGVVWRAQDTTLGRDVAIKVLPEAFVADPERMARFDREARLLASLNHPHIAAIHGLETADGVRFLAMELVEGEDLSQRLRRGPLPMAEALPLARQIAEALEHAHDRGIIHRDLKPANLKLADAGQVKVLDFGLARALEGDRAVAGASSQLSQSPTITAHMTSANVILGTAAYMSPEQARGQVVDRRADIWSFGVVLFEMLTGSQMFEGETISDTLASVLKTDPDWSRLPTDTPARVRTLLRRCLERQPRLRLRDIGEARIMLEDVLRGAPEEPGAAHAPAAAARTRAPLALVAGVALAATLVGAAGAWLLRPAAPGAPLRRYVLPLPGDGMREPRLSLISHDGDRVAYFVDDTLWVQDLTQIAPRRLGHEPEARALFWSPDGRQIGVMAGSRLTRFAVATGERVIICDTRSQFTGGSGAAWLDDGTIVFSRADSAGLLTVASTGGDLRTLLKPDTTMESDFHEPVALPGGHGILFQVHRPRIGSDNIWVLQGSRRRLVLETPRQAISRAFYSPSGHLVFRRSGDNAGVWAVPYSLSSLKTTGDPFIVVRGGLDPSVAADGTLTYRPTATGGPLQMERIALGSAVAERIGEPEAAEQLLALSADDRRVAYARTENGYEDLWVLDLARDTRTRLSFEPGSEEYADWSPDGERLVYQAIPADAPGTGPPPYQILTRRADGTGRIDTLAAGIMPSFSPDGGTIVYTDHRPAPFRWALYYLALEGDRSPKPLLDTNSRVGGARIAPGAAYVAYMSNESGEYQVYLTRFPSAEGRWQVSTAGGQWPRWSVSGDRIWYAHGTDIMEVEVALGAAPTLGTPRRVSIRRSAVTGGWGFIGPFAPSRDGRQFFVMEQAGAGTRPGSTTIVQNWFEEFRGGAKAAE
jgi:tRNA A-37 threonylcarbamoyl transferase component Bud32